LYGAVVLKLLHQVDALRGLQQEMLPVNQRHYPLPCFHSSSFSFIKLSRMSNDSCNPEY